MLTTSKQSRDVPWEDRIPGTQVSRTEVCQLMVDLAYADRDTRDVHLRSLARLGVLSGGQLATLAGLSRQRVYVKLYQWNIDSPANKVNGTLLKERANDFLRACVQLKSVKHVHADLFMRLHEAGTPGLVFHLTGVDVGRKK